MGLVDILWCCVSTGQYWLVLNGTGSVEGGTGWYWVVLGHYRVVLVDTLLGQYRAVLVGTWWYWVSVTWYYRILSGIGLVQRFYACIY